MTDTHVISRSPKNQSDVVKNIERSGARAVARAGEQARGVQREWARRPAADRSAALNAAADRIAAAPDLVDLVVREVGKPLTEARGEVARCVAILRYYGQQVYDPIGSVHEGPGLLFTRRRPRGVAGLITPWNFPVAIPMWKAAPALAFGNAVLLKPAPEATACALRLAELLELPDGLFTVLPGDAEEGEALVAAADLVSFTGSVPVGTSVVAAAAGGGIPVQAEMGGQNPAIVLPDADLERAAAQIAAAAMGYAGQKCTATKRVIGVGSVAGELRDALVAAVEGLAIGDPADAATVVGPVISEAARDRVVGATRGARVLTGGRPLDGPGWFVEPTVVDFLPDGHELGCEEVFGPICALQEAADVESALELANGVRFGLVSAVYTRDLDAALDLSGRLDTGMIKVNAPTAGVDFYLPFGGEKASSYGPREQGKAAVDFYTSTHTVTIAPSS